ncbi:MAG: flavodoxin domain-containing protein [Jhaorihella sp.]
MDHRKRRFLKYGAYSAAAAALAGVGWQFRPTTPNDAPADIALADGQGDRLLIVYGSMLGSTGGQAAWMAEVARAAGYRAALYSAENAPAPDGFDRVMVGSAIRAAAWLEPVVNWAATHAEAIAARPHSLFQCSMTCAGMLVGNQGGPLTTDQSAQLQRDTDSLFAAAPVLAQSDVAFFPGRLDFDRLTPVLRVGYPFVAGSVMQGDFRDREAAESWARSSLSKDTG